MSGARKLHRGREVGHIVHLRDVAGGMPWTETTYASYLVPACGQRGGQVADRPKDADCLRCARLDRANGGSMKPYYSDDFVTIYHGDCREIAPALTYDVVLSDPPWGIGVAVDNARFSGGNQTGPRTSVGERVPVHGDREPFDPAPWVDRPCVLWGGHCFADRLPPSAGWLIWDKRKDLEAVAEKWPLGEAELAWTNVRGSTRVFRNRWMGLVRGDEHGEHYHPTQKPVALMEWCLSFLPSGTTLDPFMGAGSTLVAAKRVGRKAIGIEIEERYCEIAAQRCSQGVLAFPAPTP